MSFSNLPTLATRPQPNLQKSAQPSRLQVKDAKDKADEKQLKAFRQAVWTRDKGCCRVCGRKVKRTLALDPLRGEVHHLRGRRVAPQDRYNVQQALLLCLADHQKAQRHEITVPTP